MSGHGRRLASGPAEVAANLDVPRETCERLEAYVGALALWNRRINLVGAGTLDQVWRRHILDCAQLARFVHPSARSLLDLGSGAGLPGLVLAIIVPFLHVHLVESDKRKAAFLRDTAVRLGLAATVHAQRAEALEPFPVDLVSARALAPLPRLLDLAAPFVTVSTRFLLLEGRSVEAGLIAVAATWTMQARIEPSLSSADGRILILDEVSRVAHPA